MRRNGDCFILLSSFIWVSLASFLVRSSFDFNSMTRLMRLIWMHTIYYWNTTIFEIGLWKHFINRWSDFGHFAFKRFWWRWIICRSNFGCNCHNSGIELCSWCFVSRSHDALLQTFAWRGKLWWQRHTSCKIPEISQKQRPKLSKTS